MTNTPAVFKRYEIKYIITKEQCRKLQEVMSEHMTIDEYGRNTINNIYFDTPNFQLIRRSIEKPCYKEKLRVRSYGKNSDTVFVEMKKKLDGIVYKRRLALTNSEAYGFLINGEQPEQNTQIAKEISYFLKHYGNLKPSVELNYEREAYIANDDENFRMTFDFNTRIKNLAKEHEGFKAVLDYEHVILEIKIHLGMPTWLLEFFSENDIYKQSFSKYGTGYKKYILPEFIGERNYVA